MSAEARTAIAAAANTVAGINCSEYIRQLEKTGDAMVYLDRVDYPDKFGGAATWTVFVVVPQDGKAAEQWIDTNMEILRVALSNELVVTSAAPASYRFDTGIERPGVAIQGIREY